jgi:hypothetical protein
MSNLNNPIYVVTCLRTGSIQLDNVVLSLYRDTASVSKVVLQIALSDMRRIVESEKGNALKLIIDT